jgi:16S rRNA (guanine966-N2)-methyltransferase
VLLDPPYDVPDATLAEVLAALVPALTVESVVVVERSTRSAAPPWPDGMHGFDTRAYGETAVHLGARSPLDDVTPDATPDAASDAPGDPAVEDARG